MLEDVLKKLEGVQTLESAMALLGVKRQRAVYLIHRLRKAGYVKTRVGPGRRRVYYISAENRAGGTSYYEVISRRSPVKLAEPETYRIHGRGIKPEEALVFAAKSGRIRLVLASLALFGAIKDWPLLHRLAKEACAERKVGALYDMARKVMRVRRMDRRTRRSMLPKKGERYQYIIDGLSSRDFRDIEDLWRVYIPFNRADMEEYQ